MIKNENLYAEEVIVESPFFYDEHGRLRARVLNEQQTLDEMSVRGPEQAPQSVTIMPSAPAAQAPVTSTASNGAPPKPPVKKRWDLGPLPPSLKKVGNGPVRQPEVQIPDQKMPTTDQGMDEIGNSRKQKPGLGKMIGGIKRPGIGGIARPMPALPRSGRATIDQGFAPGEEQGRGVARPAVGVRRPGKPLRNFRFSSQSQAGAGRNMNTRAGLSGAKPMQGRAVPATSYMEEKIDLKATKMGDVIKDFQKSDAPQFKGKSKEKRRMMAIAAKLQADRG